MLAGGDAGGAVRVVALGVSAIVRVTRLDVVLLGLMPGVMPLPLPTFITGAVMLGVLAMGRPALGDRLTLIPSRRQEPGQGPHGQQHDQAAPGAGGGNYASQSIEP